MRREKLHLSAQQNIETGLDWNGRFYIAYSGGASVFIRDRKELVRWLKIPKSIPMKASLDSWLDSLEQMDQERVSNRAQPLTDAPVMEGNGPNLSQELLATGFGPECHLDESDPNCASLLLSN